MTKQTLNGDWTLRKADGAIQTSAKVPGCVHLDLLAAGQIKDPFYRDNEKDALWVAECDWVYSRTFVADEALLSQCHILLRCEGLDTFAHVRVNGVELGRTDNMFRTWEFNLKEQLHAGENQVEVYFESLSPYMKQKQEEHFLWLTDMHYSRISGGNWVRKEQCSLGWDWAPMLPSMGIWRDISIVAFSARIEQLIIRQEMGEDCATLDLSALVQGELESGMLEVTVRDGDEIVAYGCASVADGGANLRCEVEEPKLWWPNGMGEQPLYSVSVRLKEATGAVLDEKSRRVGFRTLELVREKDEWGESFYFRANGVPFFAKGANWVPADSFDARITEADLRDLLESARDVNMNMLRSWGGGKYERDAFFDLCDELGLCVWQEFMFACSAYPVHEPAFIENVKAEAVDNVTRIQHHACIAFWCGNNELEHIYQCIGDGKEGAMNWAHYCHLFDDVLCDIVTRYDGQRAYWPSSEHSPIGNRSSEFSSDPRWGDAHLWDVWHGRKPFEWYRSALHRFCSEFGFQSFPEPRSVAEYTALEDRNITSFIMERHQRSPIGNSTILDYALSWFRLPVGFENTMWISQIIQMLGIQYAVEHWRRNMPRCMGALYWQFNDCWPVASWSSVDYAHRWKALQYAAKRFFAPVMLSSVEDLEGKKVDVFLSNDRAEARSGTLYWSLTTPDGSPVESGSEAVSIAALSSACVYSLDAAKALEAQGPRGLIAWFRFECEGEATTRSIALFSRPKHLALENPELSVQASVKGDQIHVTLTAKKPALWTWLTHPEASIRWEDSFFHMEAGETRTLAGRITEGSLDANASGLKALNIYDTFAE